MWRKIIEFKNAIIAVVIIVTITLSATAYFVKASDFREFKNEFYDYKSYQRLEYLDRRIAQFESSYNCFRDLCRSKMPTLLWEEYQNKISEKSRLEKTLLNEKEK